MVISYAGNDIFGNYGFIQCEWLNQEMACYSQRRRDAANNMIEERVNTHFSALNDLVKLSTRADVGNIVLHGDAMVRSRIRSSSGLRPADDPRSRGTSQARSVCLGCDFSSTAPPGAMASTWRTRSTTGLNPSGSIPKRELSAIIFSGCGLASP